MSNVDPHLDDRVATLVDRLKRETHADRVICHWYDTARIGYWSQTRRVRGTVLDIATAEGFRLDHATTRERQGYAELVPMGDDNEAVDHDGIVTDGGVDWHELTAFQRDLLVVIAQLDRPKGLAVKDALESLTGDPVNNGQLYPNLDELVEWGLLDKGTHDKRTNAYEITSAGRALVDQRARTFAAVVEDYDHVVDGRPDA